MDVDPSALSAWSALVVALVVKMHLTSGVQLVDRWMHHRLRNPEDVTAFARFGFRRAAVAEAGFGARADHLWRNDVENIPGFLISALALLVLGASGPAYVGVITGYGVLRVAYSVAYLGALQPWRSLCFMGALTIQAVVLGWIAALVI